MPAGHRLLRRGAERDRAEETTMFRKTTIAAAAIATAIAATPVTTAEANPPNFYFGFQTPGGYIGFGNGYGPGPGPGPFPQPQGMTCWQAKSYLSSYFNKVHKIECNGSVYTFKVWNPAGWGFKQVKINKFSGNYWFA
jgi:hypothetical protein